MIPIDNDETIQIGHRREGVGTIIELTTWARIGRCKHDCRTGNRSAVILHSNNQRIRWDLLYDVLCPVASDHNYPQSPLQSRLLSCYGMYDQYLADQCDQAPAAHLRDSCHHFEVL